MFKDGHSLFTGTYANYVSGLRDMEADFGIIPFPKYAEVDAGTVYYGYVSGGFPYIVPDNQCRPSRHHLPRSSRPRRMNPIKRSCPMYYENVVLVKQTRDDDSAEMLTMMNENRVMDMYETYWLDSIYPATIQLMINKTKDIVSTFTEQEKVIDAAFAKAVEGLPKAWLNAYA